MSIIDRRQKSVKQAQENKQRLLKRLRPALRDAIKKDVLDRSIKDFKGNLRVRVKRGSLDEPELQHDLGTGHHTDIHAGNKTYPKGLKIPIPPKSGGKGSGPGKGGGDQEDEYGFIELTPAEWKELLFADMELPNFIKEAMRKSKEFLIQRCGFVKEGTPTRLDVEKSFEMSFARRQANDSKDDDAFFEEEDLRYRHFRSIPKPSKHAVMFCVMDVSGSMSDKHKHIAKMFFILLNLFLRTSYEEVDVVFIRHTEVAKEVNEKEFFHSRESGGTVVASALKLVDKIIDERYDLRKTNIYVAQASDGDVFGDDGEESVAIIREKLLDKVQYFAYIEIMQFSYGGGGHSLMDDYEPLAQDSEKFNCVELDTVAEVFTVFENLFKKD